MTEQVNWDEDVSATSVEEYLSLVRALMRTRGFGILFVLCTPENEKALLRRMYWDVPPRDTSFLQLNAGSTNFYEATEKAIGQCTKLLFVQGLEQPLLAYQQSKRNQGWSEADVQPSSWKGVPPILANLNQQRDRLRDNFPVCFVFLISPFVQEFLIHRAPDFYDWRSGVFQYPNIRTCESCLHVTNDYLPGTCVSEILFQCRHSDEAAQELWEKEGIDAAHTCPQYQENPEFWNPPTPDPSPDYDQDDGEVPF